MGNENTKGSMTVKEEYPEDEIDLLELLGVMWVNKWWIIGITGAAVLASVLFLILPSAGKGSSSFPPVYTARSILIVNENSRLFSWYTAGRETGMNSSDMNSFWERYGTLAVKILEDENTIETLNSGTDGSYEPVKPQNLSVEFDKESGSLTVEYTSPESVFARKTVEKMTALLNGTIGSVFSGELKLKRSALNEQVENVRKSLLSSEMKLRAFEKRNGLSWGEDTEPVRFSDNELKEYISLKQDFIFEQKRMDFLNNLYYQASTEKNSRLVPFQTVEQPSVSVKNSSASSGKYSTKIIVTVLAAFFLSILWVFFLNAVRNIKSDPEKLKKLKGIK